MDKGYVVGGSTFRAWPVIDTIKIRNQKLSFEGFF